MNLGYVVGALIVHAFIALSTLGATVAICKTQLSAIDRRLEVVEKHYVPRRELDLRLGNIETWSRKSYRMLQRARLVVPNREEVTQK